MTTPTHIMSATEMRRQKRAETDTEKCETTKWKHNKDNAKSTETSLRKIMDNTKERETNTWRMEAT